MGSILINHHLNWWAQENEQRIKRCHSTIHYIDDHVDLNEDSPDSELASFCTAHGCDLLTGDKTAYVHWLERHDVRAVRISAFGMNEQSKQHMYVVGKA
jgi:hypothetical protein